MHKSWRARLLLLLYHVICVQVSESLFISILCAWDFCNDSQEQALKHSMPSSSLSMEKKIRKGENHSFLLALALSFLCPSLSFWHQCMASSPLVVPPFLSRSPLHQRSWTFSVSLHLSLSCPVMRKKCCSATACDGERERKRG